LVGEPGYLLASPHPAAPQIQMEPPGAMTPCPGSNSTLLGSGTEIFGEKA